MLKERCHRDQWGVPPKEHLSIVLHNFWDRLVAATLLELVMGCWEPNYHLKREHLPFVVPFLGYGPLLEKAVDPAVTHESHEHQRIGHHAAHSSTAHTTHHHQGQKLFHLVP